MSAVYTVSNYCLFLSKCVYLAVWMYFLDIFGSIDRKNISEVHTMWNVVDWVK